MTNKIDSCHPKEQKNDPYKTDRKIMKYQN